MNRDVPIWVLLLCLLIGALFTVFFGWSVKSTVSGSHWSGRFGQVAVTIVSFPALAKSVFTDIRINTIDSDEPIRGPSAGIDFSEFTKVHSKQGIEVEGLFMRADMSLLARASGWRILVGAFTIDGEVKNAALALSSELEIVKVWILSEDEIDGEIPSPTHRKFIHGFDIMKDGSVIFAFDGGVSLQRFDQCGSRIWATGGGFHHAVTLDDSEDFVWALRDTLDDALRDTLDDALKSYEIVKVSTATGEVVQHFSILDISAANPTIDILEIRKYDDNDLGGNSRNTTEKWLQGPLHLNDVDPLPAALATYYDGFEAGDLLVSARSLNLVFVVDPETLEIKWWRSGATRRQHDPDWGRSGKITIYDNRMSRDYSRIVSISHKTLHTNVLFDGRKNGFYSRIRGKHQITKTGNLIVTSAQQGRVFEIDPNGNMVFELINRKPGSEEYNYVLSQVTWFPSDAFDFGGTMSCEY